MWSGRLCRTLTVVSRHPIVRVRISLHYRCSTLCAVSSETGSGTKVKLRVGDADLIYLTLVLSSSSSSGVIFVLASKRVRSHLHAERLDDQPFNSYHSVTRPENKTNHLILTSTVARDIESYWTLHFSAIPLSPFLVVDWIWTNTWNTYCMKRVVTNTLQIWCLWLHTVVYRGKWAFWHAGAVVMFGGCFRKALLESDRGRSSEHSKVACSTRLCYAVQIYLAFVSY